MAKRKNRQVEKKLMVIHTRLEIIDILQITNRRFMYHPMSQTLILGDEKFGKDICSSHAQEFYESKVEGHFDDYLRGWIGAGCEYPHGIIHFAPSVGRKLFDKGVDTLQMFAKLNGVDKGTIIWGFCELLEIKISTLLPDSFDAI